MSIKLASRLFSLGRRGMGLLQGLGTVTILAVLAFTLYRNRTQFEEATFSFDYGLVALSFVLWVGSYLLFALGWHLVLRGLGSPIGWWKASRVWILSQGLKYIPGSLAYALGRVYMAREEGVRGVPATIGFALENLLPLVTAVLVFVALLPFGLVQGFPLVFAPVALGILLGLVLGLPLFLGRLSAVWPGVGKVSLDYFAMGLLLAFYLLVWLVVGLACYFSFRSLGQGFSLGPLQVLGLYALSWAAGFVAVFAPGGVGVRDGMLILLMSGSIPLPMAVLGAALVRTETLAVEGLLALLAMKAWPVPRT